jgi:hypothetical protein
MFPKEPRQNGRGQQGRTSVKHIAIGLAFLLASSAANAAIVPWSTVLLPQNEVLPVLDSNGSGSAEGTVDTITGLLTWTVAWTGLTGPATAAHFHGPATPDQTAPPIVDIGMTSGLSSPSAGSATISALHVQQLLANLWYVNVHTVRHPPGEIRGQVAPVPLPASLPLLLGAGAVLGLAARRRRNAAESPGQAAT